MTADDLNTHYNPKPSKLSLQERFEKCFSVAEECITEEELKELL